MALAGSNPSDWFGRDAAILILELRISVGSLTAAHNNYAGVRCVPFSAPYTASFSVSYGENRPSNSVNQRPRCAHNGHL
jgi:hypothetical protein